MLHRLGGIEAEPFVAVDAELPEMRPAVVLLGNMDHHLGRHAADACTGRAGRAAVDQHEGTHGLARLGHGIEAGAAGTDDDDVDLTFLHD